MLDVDARFRETAQLRGALLGLALGESLARTDTGAADGAPLLVGPAGQLAAFTVEGLIRREVRWAHRGIAARTAVVSHAYGRWAWARDAESPAGEASRRQWAGGREWPTGWLVEVPGIVARRGSATVTEQALTEWPDGSPTPQDADDWYALARVLPLLAGPGGTAEHRLELARDLAAVTHAHPEAARAVTAAARIVATAQHTPHGADLELPADDEIAHAVDAAAKNPGQVALVDELVPDDTALSVLRGAVYAALSHPSPGAVEDAVRLAAGARHGDGVAALTGALHGVAHGADALPVRLVARLDVAWALDVLARDLVTEVYDGPGGDAYAPALDPAWTQRYPGD